MLLKTGIILIAITLLAIRILVYWHDKDVTVMCTGEKKKMLFGDGSQ